jgi:hypothetical protein
VANRELVFVSRYHKKNRNLIDASKEVGLEVNAERTKYMLVSCHQKAGQNHNIKIGDRSFGNVVQFKYLGMTNKSKFNSEGN